MIDILEFLLKWVKEGATAYKTHQSDETQKEFISALFNVQNELTYLIIRGEKIISLVTQYVDKFHASSATDKRFIHYRDEIKRLLVAQSKSIEKIRFILYELWPTLRAIDFNLVKELQDSLNLKLEKLNWLEEFLSNGHYPIDTNSRTIPNTVLLTDNTSATYQKLKDYLEHDSPTQRIEKLRENATEISRFLSANFETERILLITMDKARRDIA